jgi:hypothetical protein
VTPTIGQRTKSYFGRGDDEDRVTATSIGRHVAAAVVVLLVGILIWSFWSTSFGSWLVFFGVITVAVLPIVRHRQRKTHQRRNRPAGVPLSAGLMRYLFPECRSAVATALWKYGRPVREVGWYSENQSGDGTRRAEGPSGSVSAPAPCSVGAPRPPVIGTSEEG